jgi:hypothetical protein
MESKRIKYGYDPLTTVCKLALLGFYPENTKMSFYDNNIYIQPPVMTQGMSRYYYGDSKKDLQQLLKPIVHCVNKYVLKNDDNFVKNIMTLCVDGIKLLQKTYKTNKPIVLMLQSYIDLIIDSLKGHKKDYTNLGDIYDDINNIYECDGLWSDLSIQVASDKLDHLVCEYDKMVDNEEDGEKEKEEEKVTIEHEFERIKDEFILFIDAKHAKYDEFIKNKK